MVYTRGSNEEYDRWANLTADDGWKWENVTPFYLKVCISHRIVLMIFVNS